ncbi:protein of unknown function (plasmid) [Azospirillum lipoferum 4B]|uniref:Uncharacterized protein n=1 Tax=Azospirillum lipoferum (strain 4B) TaxID=862719 RepID=G7ZJ38_AZOL4|nr:protein of unknown function [Azospirillum lipoferum 4B]
MTAFDGDPSKAVASIAGAGIRPLGFRGHVPAGLRLRPSSGIGHGTGAAGDITFSGHGRVVRACSTVTVRGWFLCRRKCAM